MPVHQQADDDRGRDQGATSPVAEHDAEDDGQQGRSDDDDEERQDDMSRGRLAEVLRPQEQDGVGGQQHRMERGKSARFRGGLDRRFGRQENLRGGRRLG